MYLDFVEVKNDYLCAAKRAYESGIQTGTGGNLSVRIPNDQLMLIKPSGNTFGSLSEENLTVSDFEGNVVEGKYQPSKESNLHGKIYQNYDWVGGIVHTHSVYSILCSLSFDFINTITMHTKLKLKVDIPVVDVTTMIVTNKEMEKIYNILDKNTEIKALVLRGHGIVSLGKTAVEAERRAELIEETAKIFWEITKRRNI